MLCSGKILSVSGRLTRQFTPVPFLFCTDVHGAVRQDVRVVGVGYVQAGPELQERRAPGRLPQRVQRSVLQHLRQRLEPIAQTDCVFMKVIGRA